MDDTPIKFIPHPRDTMLGMTLLLESYFPDAEPLTLNSCAYEILTGKKYG